MKRAEVWLINLDPTIGAELRKTRPAIIVNGNALGKLPLKVIVPITDWKQRYDISPWMVKLEPTPQNGLTKVSAVDTFQVRSLSQKRFVKRLGRLTQEDMKNIAQALTAVLKLNT